MSDMHKRELIERVAKASGYSRYAVEDILGDTVTVIAATLAAGEAVVWTGLGRFERRELAAKGAFNPRTREPMVLPARTTVGCTVSETFKRRVAALGAVGDEAEAAD